MEMTPSLAFLLAVAGSPVVEERFEPGWAARWMERKLAPRATLYRAVEEPGGWILEGQSEKAASGLWNMLSFHATGSVELSWRWKVEGALTHHRQERKKEGDDFAARLFVVFEPALVDWKTRALCYVWAADEPPGSRFLSPRSKSVGTIVVESGNERARQWVQEKRDLLADYRDFFRSEPEMISALAIMVDTDDTLTRATAWFDDIKLDLGPAPSPNPGRRPKE